MGRKVSYPPNGGYETFRPSFVTVRYCLDFVYFAFDVCSVQQVMCFLTSWFAEEGCVQLLDGRILVGFADRVVFVGVVEDFRTQAADIDGVAYIARLLRLAAAVDASARAAHDLDEVVGCFAGFDFLEQLLCVAETGGDGDLASLMPSMPRTSVKSRFFNSSPVRVSTAVRSAASITPPVAPKMTAAPVPRPSGASYSSSGSVLNFRPTLRIMRASSLVVRE